MARQVAPASFPDAQDAEPPLDGDEPLAVADDGQFDDRPQSMPPVQQRQSFLPPQRAPGWLGWLPVVMRGHSAVASLIGMLVEFMLVIQDIQSFLNQDAQPKNPPKGKATTKSPDNSLLGRSLVALVEPTHRFVQRSIVYRRADKPTPASSASIEYYVPNTDIPNRTGAVGFTVSSHLFTAVLFALLIWVDWLEYKQRPIFLGRWAPPIIGGIQCFFAFDLLGRNISKAAQGGAYLMFVFSLANIGYSVYTVMRRPRLQEEPYYADEQEPYPEDEAPLEGDEAALEDEKLAEDVLPAEQPTNRRSRTVSSVVSSSVNTDDVDSYYLRSPNAGAGQTRLAFPEPTYAGQHLSPSHANARAGASSPISLYGPAEQQRRIEQQRRSRRLSLTGPAVGSGANFNKPGTFHQRSFDAVKEEDEEEDEVQALPPVDTSRVSRDGFANRAKEWKKLQRM